MRSNLEEELELKDTIGPYYVTNAISLVSPHHVGRHNLLLGSYSVERLMSQCSALSHAIKAFGMVKEHDSNRHMR